VGKHKFHYFWLPLGKILEKSASAPPWKKSFRRPWTYGNHKSSNKETKTRVLCSEFYLFLFFLNERNVKLSDWALPQCFCEILSTQITPGLLRWTQTFLLSLQSEFSQFHLHFAVNTDRNCDKRGVASFVQFILFGKLMKICDEKNKTHKQNKTTAHDCVRFAHRRTTSRLTTGSKRQEKNSREIESEKAILDKKLARVL